MSSRDNRAGPGNTARPPRWLWRAASLVLLATVWEIGGHLANPLVFPPLSRVAAAWVEILRSGELVQGFILSLSALMLGLALSLTVGIVLGVLMGVVPLL